MGVVVVMMMVGLLLVVIVAAAAVRPRVAACNAVLGRPYKINVLADLAKLHACRDNVSLVLDAGDAGDAWLGNVMYSPSFSARAPTTLSYHFSNDLSDMSPSRYEFWRSRTTVLASLSSRFSRSFFLIIRESSHPDLTAVRILPHAATVATGARAMLVVMRCNVRWGDLLKGISRSGR